jgi:hypothetical protein
MPSVLPQARASLTLLVRRDTPTLPLRFRSVVRLVMARRTKATFPLVLVLFGVLGIFRVLDITGSPVWRTVAVVQLVASGMCFGVALWWMVARLRRKVLEKDPVDDYADRSI